MDFHATCACIGRGQLDSAVSLLCQVSPLFAHSAACQLQSSRLDPDTGCFSLPDDACSTPSQHSHLHACLAAAAASLCAAPAEPAAPPHEHAQQATPHLGNNDTSAAVQRHVLQQLLPALLSSQAPCPASSLQSHPVAGRLCTAFLAASGLQPKTSSTTAFKPGITGQPAPPADAEAAALPFGKNGSTGTVAWLVQHCCASLQSPQRSELTLGTASALALLTSLVQHSVSEAQANTASEGSAAGLLQQILDTAAAACASWGGDARRHLLTTTLPAALDAASTVLPSAQYHAACRSVVAALNQPIRSHCSLFTHPLSCAATTTTAAAAAAAATPCTTTAAAVAPCTSAAAAEARAAPCVDRDSKGGAHTGPASSSMKSEWRGCTLGAADAMYEHTNPEPTTRACVAAPSAAVSAAFAAACQLQRHVLEACVRTPADQTDRLCNLQPGAQAAQLASAAQREDRSSCWPVPDQGTALFWLHALVLCGLCHRDNHTRARAVHLLRCLVAEDHAPPGPAFSQQQWGAFCSIFQAQEEHMLHLVQPVWQAGYTQLWDACTVRPSPPPVSSAAPSPPPSAPAPAPAPAKGAGGVTQGLLNPATAAQRVVWVGALLRKAAANSNASVRSLGLHSFLAMPPVVLDALAQDAGAWAELQELLLQLVPTFDNEKLVPVALGHPHQSAATAGAQRLQCALSSFLGRCLHSLAQHQQQHLQHQIDYPPALQPQKQQHTSEHSCSTTAAATQPPPQPSSCMQLVLQLLQKVGQSAQRAPSAVLVLQAIADACESLEEQQLPSNQHTTTKGGSTSTGSTASTSLHMHPHHLQSHIQPLLQRIHFLRPPWLCGAARGAVLRIVAHCAPLCCERISAAAAAGAGRASSGVSSGDTPVMYSGSDSPVTHTSSSWGFEDTLTLLSACAPHDLSTPRTLPPTPAGTHSALHEHEAVDAVACAGPCVSAWLAGQAFGQTARVVGIAADARQCPLLQVWLQGCLGVCGRGDLGLEENRQGEEKEGLSGRSGEQSNMPSIQQQQQQQQLPPSALPSHSHSHTLAAPACPTQLSHLRVLLCVLLHSSHSHTPSSRQHTAPSSDGVSACIREAVVCCLTLARHTPGHTSATTLACVCATVLSTTPPQQQQQQDAEWLQQDRHDLESLRAWLLWQALPVLLRHHKEVVCPSSRWDPQWHAWMKAAVWAAFEAGAVQRLPGSLELAQQLSAWLPDVMHELREVASSSQGPEQPSLANQLTLLSSAQLCFAGILHPWQLKQQQQQQQQQHNHQQQQQHQQEAGNTDISSSCGGSHHSVTLQSDPEARWAPSALSLLCELGCGNNTPAEEEATGYTASMDASELAQTFDLQRTQAMALAARAAQPILQSSCCSSNQELRRHVFLRCTAQLQWTSAATGELDALLEVLHATAPFRLLQQISHHSHHHQHQHQHRPGQPSSASNQGSTAADGHINDAVTTAIEDTTQLMGQLPGLVLGSARKGMSDGAIVSLLRLFVHPSYMHIIELRRLLDGRLIPLLLANGGAKLAVGLAAHLCQQVLLPGSTALHDHLPHLTHLLAFSTFAEAPPSSTAAAAAARVDASVTLPPRVIVCSHLAGIAREGTDPEFVAQLVKRLLAITGGGAPEYSWLQAREAGQASLANGIKVSAWQVLCLLAPFVPARMREQVLEQAWQCLLQSHQHGNVRPYCQLFLVALLAKHPQGITSHVMPALLDFNAPSYQVTVSIILVALFYLLHVGCGSPHFFALVKTLIPWALHHRHAVRLPTQVLLHYIFERHLGQLKRELGAANTSVLSEMQRFLSQNGEMVQLRERQSLLDIKSFDLGFETSLAGVFGITQEDVDAMCDGETDTAGLLWPVYTRDRLPMDILSKLPGAVKAVGRAAASKGPSAEDDAEQEDEDGGFTGPSFQQFRPQMAQSAPLDGTLSILPESVGEGLDQLVQARQAQEGLVLVASLLENVPNQAGLCRTCESLSVEALALPSHAVVATDAFKKQSVTSERWLRLLEVGPRDVAAFLLERKACGYTVIGIEQATNSVALQAYTFPRKAVLLLGNEQSGIPAPLLHHLDVCVEIPTLGVTRSMNAHVCGAMVCWQYTQQWLSK